MAGAETSLYWSLTSMEEYSYLHPIEWSSSKPYCSPSQLIKKRPLNSIAWRTNGGIPILSPPWVRRRLPNNLPVDSQVKALWTKTANSNWPSTSTFFNAHGQMFWPSSSKLNDLPRPDCWPSGPKLNGRSWWFETDIDCRFFMDAWVRFKWP